MTSLAEHIAATRRGWDWFVEGLVEAALWAGRRGRPAAPCRLVVEGDAGRILAPDGAEIGRLAPDRPAPPDLAGGLAGRDLDLVVPDAWFFRRDLDPVAAQSRPFLAPFVQHQIERLTPWRADAVHHRILAELLPGDANRLAVSVLIVPKRLVAPWLDPLRGAGLGTVRLRTGSRPAEAILVSAAAPRTAALRRVVSWSIVGLAAATVALVAVLEWQAGAVRTDVEDGNRVIAERKAVLARARASNGTGDGPAARLASLRAAHPLAVAVIDALATALPDSASLTALTIDGDAVAIAGVSTDPPALVPALERSGRFKGVAAAAATTRIGPGQGERFSLDMTALPPEAPREARP